MSRSEPVQTNLKIFQTTKDYLFLNIIFCSFSQSRASLMPWKLVQRRLPLLSCLLLSWPQSLPSCHPPTWAFLPGAGAGSPQSHVRDLSIQPTSLFTWRFGEAVKHYPLVWTSHSLWLVFILNSLVKMGVREIYFHPCLESCWGFLGSQEKIRLPSIMDFGNGWGNWWRSEVERVSEIRKKTLLTPHDLASCVCRVLCFLLLMQWLRKRWPESRQRVFWGL